MKTNAIRYLYLAGVITGLCCTGAHAVTNEGNQFSVGVEGFWDNYQEPVATVDSKATYGSVTADYSHNWNKFFAALDGRVSYGFDNYESDSGTADRIPQWELEGRIRGGYTFTFAKGGLSPYIGVGTRYYWDELKGAVTNLGALGYDRRITQIYLPIGVTFARQISDSWSVSPNLEYDQFLWGQVSSRLGTISGFNNIINHQSSGWGIRGSVMFGWRPSEDSGGVWQAGPFIRYWNISDSDTTDGGFFEPHNTRIQAGLAVRYLW